MKTKKTRIYSPNSTWQNDLELTVLRCKKHQSTTEKASSRPGFLNVAHFGLIDRVGCSTSSRMLVAHALCPRLSAATKDVSRQHQGPLGAGPSTGEPLGNTTGSTLAQPCSPVFLNTTGNTSGAQGASLSSHNRKESSASLLCTGDGNGQ